MLIQGGVVSNSLSNHLSPALLPLSVFPTWQQAGGTLKQRALLYSQDIYKMWDNALQFRREVGVDQIVQASAAPQAMVALTQSRTGLFAQEVVIVKHRARQAVTAMRTMEGGVRLVSWRVNADGSLLRTGSSSLQLDEVVQIKLVHARNYVLACRTANGEIHLSRWDVSNTGAIYLAGTHNGCAEQIQWFEVAALTPDLIVTFGLTTAQTWQLMLWQLQGDSGLQLLHYHEIPAAAVNSCGLAVLPQRDGSVRWATVSAETPTTLALHLWQHTAGQALTLVATHRIPTVGGSAAMAAVMIAHVDEHYMQLVVQRVTGELHLLTCRLVDDEQVMMTDHGVRLSETVSQCACQPHPAGFTLVSYTAAGVLLVQRWQQQSDGTLLLLDTAHSAATHLAEVTCCDAVLEGNAPLLTGLIDDQGELILTTWG